MMKSINWDSRAQKSWLVSFGDLLTLLLTLFIFQFSNVGIQSAHSGQSNPLTTRENSSQQYPGTSEYGSEDRGTLLAPLKSVNSQVERVFRGDDFDMESHELLLSGREGIKKIVIPEGYEVEKIHIVTCSPQEVTADALAWVVSTARALSIRSQLIDAGYAGEQIGVQARGRNCSDGHFGKEKIRNEENRSVGRIRIKVKALS